MRKFAVFLLIVFAHTTYGQDWLMPNNDATDTDPETSDFVRLKDYEGPLKDIIEKRYTNVVTFVSFLDEEKQKVDIQECTGTFIAPNVVITASHCYTEDFVSEFNIGELFAVTGAKGEDEEGNFIYSNLYHVTEIIERGSPGNAFTDYMIFKVSPYIDESDPTTGPIDPPEAAVDFTPLLGYTPDVGLPVALIGHPIKYYGGPSAELEDDGIAVESAFVTFNANNNKTTIGNISYHRVGHIFHGMYGIANTSGSGLLDPFGNIIALHNTSFSNIPDSFDANPNDAPPGIGGRGYAIYDALLVSRYLQTITSTVGIGVDADEEVAQVVLWVQAGDKPEQFYNHQYIRTHSEADFRKLRRQRNFISAEKGDEVRFTGFVGAFSQPNHRITNIKIEEVIPNVVGHNYNTQVVKNIAPSSNYMAQGSYVMGDHPIFITFEFDDCYDCVPRADLLKSLGEEPDQQNNEILNHGQNNTGGTETLEMNESLTIVPNPSHIDEATLSLESPISGEATIEIVDDFTGVPVYNATERVVFGKNDLRIKSNIAPGIYIVRAKVAGTIFTKRIIIEEN